MADRLPFLTLSSRRPADGSSMSSGDSAYGSSPGDEKTPSATHDISRVNFHIKHLPDFARTLEDSAARAFPNCGHSQRYKKVHALLLHWKCDDLFVLPELEDLETCFREDYNFETETFSIPSDNAHLDLMLKIGAMIKEYESQDTLFIVYYGGHARIDNSRQSTWCANRSSDSPWLHITETISASSWDAIAPDPGRYSFTSALIEVLQEWKDRTFSAAMVHAEVLARLKHPRPERRNGKHFEARSTPVHFMMTANHRAPSIEISRTVSCDMRPPSPPQELMFEDSSSAGRYAGPQEIIGSEPSEDVPHVMISLALEDDQRLNINDWEHWLQSIPAIAKHVEFAWEAPTAEALYRKFRAKGWAGQCFVLKGHYREFSESFDKYIVGIKMTDNARTYLLSLRENTREETNTQLYDEWFKQLEDEDRRHPDLVPTVKAERMEAMVRHQKELEDEFERQQPSLHRKALDLQPAIQDGRWDVKGPMVAPLARGIAKLHDNGTDAGSGKSRHQEKLLATPPGVEDYDLLESDEEQLASERAARKSRTGSRETLQTDDVAAEKKQTRMYGGRGLFNKFIRSGRADGSRAIRGSNEPAA
ncbi:hypothetical protein DL766_004503 [Monosporascus sp. MC13-8B]|uniref:Uncharacterized protein n=1 Tax=Monosporascus cannonballus TaxID=155416 RepID=A0ABY0H8Q2_9PEZI|nr:hypothetical protein DL762_005649 [Monosporascus cannonballus]RYO86120.1 hypothetical protein DL763_006813 [Monosporascus cannonballus]RYP31195.1 hypothetical protein DL766_004503 [Monosporascus sp. MC13-8B]